MTDDSESGRDGEAWRRLVEELRRDHGYARGSLQLATVLSNVTADDGIDILAYDAAGQRSAVWQAKFSGLDEADIAALRRSVVNRLLTAAPQTPEEAQEVERAVEQVVSDPECLSMISRVTSGIKNADVAGLTAASGELLALTTSALIKRASQVSQ